MPSGCKGTFHPSTAPLSQQKCVGSEQQPTNFKTTSPSEHAVDVPRCCCSSRACAYSSYPNKHMVLILGCKTIMLTRPQSTPVPCCCSATKPHTSLTRHVAHSLQPRMCPSLASCARQWHIIAATLNNTRRRHYHLHLTAHLLLLNTAYVRISICYVAPVSPQVTTWTCFLSGRSHTAKIASTHPPRDPPSEAQSSALASPAAAAGHGG